MKKMNYLKIFILLINIVILTRLFFICIIKHDYYQEILDDNINKVIYTGIPPRGRILDSKGNVLVDNKGLKVLIFNKLPGITKDSEIIIAKELAKIIDMDTKNVSKSTLKQYYYILNEGNVLELVSDKIMLDYQNRLITKDTLMNYCFNLITDEMLESINKEEALIYNLMNKGYSYQEKVIKRNITNEEFTKINELNLEGIHIDIHHERIFNYDTCLNTLFGAIGNIPVEEKEAYLKKGYNLEDIVGVSFLEKTYEEYLKGEKGTYQVNEDNTLSRLTDEKRGNDLILNIDIEKQLAIEEVLRREIQNAKKYPSSKYYNGSYIVVSNPKDGSVISLVALKYNGEFTSDVVGLLTNSYTVGSVVKGASQTVAYKYGAIDEFTKINDGCVKLFSQKEKCSWKNLGTLNDISALTNSSNYFQFISAIKVSGFKYKRNMKFNPTINDFNKYRNIFKSYGLGSKTEIDIEEEQLGITGKTVSGDLLLNLSIGQYDTYTPLMLNQYISTIANNGERLKLRIADAIIDQEGNKHIINKKTVLNKVDIKPKYLNRIQKGMRDVIRIGTASSYTNKKYFASGKTGTSETFYKGKNTTTKSFVMYAPSDNPEYAISIISPNISTDNKKSNYKYPINSRLSRQITEILFEK